MQIFILFLFGPLTFAQGHVLNISGLSSRIVNGVSVNPGEIPYQVSLQRENHFCGGSIVNENWVVTAAHCVDDGLHQGISIIVGTVKLTNPHSSHPAAKVIVHENYKPADSDRNDIALIRVKTPFVFSDLVQPVELPEPNVRVKINSTAVVSGWGTLVNPWSPTPNELRKAKIYIADPEYCFNIMKEVNEEVYPTNVCAYDPTTRRGQCSGDSGGPLVVEGKLTGIVSWSIKDPICASTKYPGVYTRVSKYVDWIFKHAQ